jgi:parallel beta-helix repeat protein
LNPRYLRATLGVVLALGMLGVVPSVVLAAQPSCGDTITHDTTLTADLDCTGLGGGAGIYFGVKNITLNLNGHTIWGPVGDDSTTGVDTNYKKNVTVKNGTIADFGYYGVLANYTVAGTFKNLKVQGEDADRNQDIGIYVYYGADNTSSGNTMKNVYYGFYGYGSGGNWFTNNRMTDVTYGLYDEYENGDHWTGNYTEYDYAGFYEDYSGNQVFSGNTANGGPDSGSYGFYFDGDDYGWYKITNNVAKNNGSYGFYTYYLYESDNAAGPISQITGNKSNHNEYGFYDEESQYANYSNNTANHNEEDGFYMYDSGYVHLNGNTANDNGSDGIYLYDNYTPYYSPATANNNTTNDNDSYGIEADYGMPGATGNVAHDNGNAPDDCWNINCNN